MSVRITTRGLIAALAGVAPSYRRLAFVAGLLTAAIASSFALQTASAPSSSSPISPQSTVLPVRAGTTGSTVIDNRGLNLGPAGLVSMGAAEELGLTTFTLELWFRWHGGGLPVSTGIQGVAAYPLISRGRDSDDGLNYLLGLQPQNGGLVAAFQERATAAGAGASHPVFGMTPIVRDEWHHAAATYDGRCWRLFLDGQPDGINCPEALPNSDSRQHFALGAALDSRGIPEGSFEGAIDEVRVWDRALVQHEISDNMRARARQNARGLVCEWRFDEGGGGVAQDSGRSGLEGTISGAYWVVEGAQQAKGDSVVPFAGTRASGGVTRQPYLMLVTETNVTIGWRSNIATDSVVHYGTVEGALTSTASDVATVTDHFVTISGLTLGQKYFYEVGDSLGGFTFHAGGTASHYFVTAPTSGGVTPFTIWAVGDGGNGTSQQLDVMNAMLTENGGESPDLALYLGDMAYNSGTDFEYTNNYFAPYAPVIRNTAVWPTLGNHDGSSAYYAAFVLPAGAEAGGVASGTEAYYSFDYGNAHFISLNSQSVPRSPTGAMATWLTADLAANTADWTVAYWHHPPYSKGTHDSDTEGQLIEMRENIVPILEAAGVDLVLTGHSHTYERSYLIDGAYSTPTPNFGALLAAGNIIDPGNGNPAGDGAYVKSAGPNPHEGTVYVVAGHGGRELGGSILHPVMVFFEAAFGSVLIDVSTTELNLRNVRRDGAITDSFTISKGCGVATISIPTELTGLQGQTVTVPVEIGDVTGKEVFAAEIDVSFEPSVISPTSVVPGAALIGKDCALVDDMTVPGHVRLAISCQEALDGGGSLADLSFRVESSTYGATTALEFPEAMLNEGCPAVIANAGLFTVSCVGAVDGAACDNDTACDGRETCQNEVCTSAAPLDCDDGNPCTVDSCDAEAGCEQTPGNPGVVCRAAAGSCDVEEACTGSSSECPDDVKVPAGTACRDSAGACDDGASCSGLGNDCPPSVYTCSVDGNVFYYRDSPSGRKPVSDVTIDVTGFATGTTTTDPAGAYSFDGLFGDVTVTPAPLWGGARATSYPGVITAFDASTIARVAIGLIRPTAGQKIAGDVTGNGGISALDASFVAQYSAALIDHFAVAIASGSDWRFIPVAYDFNPIGESQTGKEYAGILYGDITGNWTGPAPLQAVASLPRVAGEALPGQVNPLTRAQQGPVPTAPRAALWMTDWPAPLREGDQRRVLIQLESAGRILGLDLSLTFDPSEIAIIGVQATGVATGFTVVQSSRQGTCRIAAYGVVPLSGAGPALIVTVKALQHTGREIPLAISGVANEGAIPLDVRGQGGRMPAPPIEQPHDGG